MPEFILSSQGVVKMFRTNIARISKTLRDYAASVSMRQAAFIVVGLRFHPSEFTTSISSRASQRGGVIGLILLANRWLGLSPSIATPVLDAACYLFASDSSAGASYASPSQARRASRCFSAYGNSSRRFYRICRPRAYRRAARRPLRRYRRRPRHTRRRLVRRQHAI